MDRGEGGGDLQSLFGGRMSKYYAVEQIAKAMKPQLVNGVWQKPKLSARRIARIRKECLRYGTINGIQARTISVLNE